jgi:hypothetical protein
VCGIDRHARWVPAMTQKHSGSHCRCRRRNRPCAKFCSSCGGKLRLAPLQDVGDDTWNRAVRELLNSPPDSARRCRLYPVIKGGPDAAGTEDGEAGRWPAAVREPPVDSRETKAGCRKIEKPIKDYQKR